MFLYNSLFFFNYQYLVHVACTSKLCVHPGIIIRRNAGLGERGRSLGRHCHAPSLHVGDLPSHRGCAAAPWLLGTLVKVSNN